MQAWVIGNWKQNPATSQDVNILLDDLLANVAKKRSDHIRGIKSLSADGGAKFHSFSSCQRLFER